MNNRRDFETNAAAAPPTSSPSANLVETVSKMLVNGTCVALTMYPLDRAIHAIQVNGSHIKASSGIGKSLFSFAFMQSQFNPFLTSAKVYVQRNAVASNRGAIAEGIDGLEILEAPFMKAGVLAVSISVFLRWFSPWPPGNGRPSARCAPVRRESRTPQPWLRC